MTETLAKDTLSGTPLAQRLAAPEKGKAKGKGEAEQPHLATLLQENRALSALVKRAPPAGALLARIADGSPFLWQLCESDPERLLRLLEGDPQTARDALLAEARAAADGEEVDEAHVMRRLRKLKAEMALLLALADLGGVWDVPVVTAALSDFADAAISAGLRFLLREAAGRGKIALPDLADPEQGCGLTVLAMGKHGARELNYSSDIDLIVFYDRQNAPLDEDDAPPFYIRLVQHLVRILQERTEDGYVFRTDLRLRPDPGSTPVAISVEAALSYYETVGQNWERAAMLKARPAAGDARVGEEVLHALVPFIWRKHLDYAAIADIHAMKRQIQMHRGHGAVAIEGHNVKLGRGGIREIEFFVQTQQLVAGGRIPDLRVRGTEAALAALVEHNWIDEKTRDDLVRAYRFLRSVEHRIQMVADEQTHMLPEDRDSMERLARFAGFDSRDAFARALQAELECVQEHYSHLFEDAQPLAASSGSLVFTGEEDDPETLDTLHRMGFREPSMVAGLVRAWHHGRVVATRSARARELLTELIPALLDAMTRTSDPDSALRAFDRVLARQPAGIEFFSLLRSNPGFLGLLADVLGTAPRLADLVGRRPHVLDAVLEADFFSALPDEELVRERLDQTLNEARSYEDVLDRARIFAQEHKVLIGVRVLSGAITAERAGEAFAKLADLLIERVHAAAEAEMVRAHGTVPGGRSTILAMGKLGGREMTFASDLDLILIYDHPDDVTSSEGGRELAPSQYYARLTQRIVSALSAPTAEGTLYEVDFRLRPSGHSGPLATRFSAFQRYQREEAWTWEHMALTRARPISGDGAFRAEVEAEVAEVLTAEHERKKLAKDVRDMRRTLAVEKGEDDPWELKTAVGGLIDLEFIAQFLQLAHGHAHPEILSTTTIRVFEAAAHAKLLAQEDYELLRAATRLQHDLTQLLRLCLSESFDPKTAGAGLLALLARAGGDPDFAALSSELKDTQKGVRKLFTKLVTA